MISRWEIFEPGETKPFADRVHITLNRKHVFCMNANVQEMLGRPEAVVLMFDRKENIIGLSAAPITVKGTFRLLPMGRGHSHRIIRASSFCRHFGICLDNTSAFLQPRLDEDGVLLLDLKAITPARARRRSKRKTASGCGG
jgi:hypothetical protein